MSGKAQYCVKELAIKINECLLITHFSMFYSNGCTKYFCTLEWLYINRVRLGFEH